MDDIFNIFRGTSMTQETSILIYSEWSIDRWHMDPFWTWSSSSAATSRSGWHLGCVIWSCLGVSLLICSCFILSCYVHWLERPSHPKPIWLPNLNLLLGECGQLVLVPVPANQVIQVRDRSPRGKCPCPDNPAKIHRYGASPAHKINQNQSIWNQNGLRKPIHRLSQI